MKKGNATGKNHCSGVSHIARDYFPLFSLNLCGLVAIRIWIQCTLYDRYMSTDSGIVTIVSNLVRVLLIVILLAVFIRKGFSHKAQKILGYISIVTMTLASLLFLINSDISSQSILWIACICAGCGIVWGGGMWICLYVRLPPGEALFYAFFSLGVSSFLGFFLGLFPENIIYLIAILMPTLSLIGYQNAQRLVDTRESGGLAPDFDSDVGLRDTGRDTLYDKEPKSTFIRLIIGIALFNLALGIARGFPSGESIALPVTFQAIHQFASFFLSLYLIWWVLGKGRSIHFSTLWNISMTLIVLGVLALAIDDPLFTPLGATLISMSNTFAIGLLWFSCYDVSRHSSVSPYIILGVAWAAHILPRELARASIWVLEPHSAVATTITALIVFLLALSMAFLLNDSIPTVRHLFADFRHNGSKNLLRHRFLGRTEKEPQYPTDTTSVNVKILEATLPCDDETASSKPLTEADSAEAQLTRLAKQYFLTEREIEVVRLLAQGRTRINIGLKLFITENTVRTYVKNIYVKLNIHSKQELIDRLEELKDKD